MRRFWIDETPEAGQNQIILTGELVHHVKDVCRMKPGAHFEVLTPDGKACFVELKSIDKKRAIVEILEKRELPVIPGPQVRLIVSVPRFATLESIIEKSVELGVHSIQPVFSDFSFVSNSNKISASRLARWEKIVKSATQQSGRGDLMPVHAPETLQEVLKNFNQNNGLRGLFAYEGRSELSLKQALEAWEPAEELKEIWLFVGSEGGFSEKEVELFQQHKLAPVTLGEQILRVETACVALLSIIKYQVNALG